MEKLKSYKYWMPWEEDFLFYDFYNSILFEVLLCASILPIQKEVKPF